MSTCRRDTTSILSAPQRYAVSVDGDKTIGIEPKNESHVGNDLRLPLRVPVRANEGGLCNPESASDALLLS